MPKQSFFFLIFFLGVPLIQAKDDIQHWNAYQWRLFKNERLNLNLYMENRVRDDVSKASGYFVGPTIRFKASKQFTVGAAVKMIYLKFNDQGFNKWQRTEIEGTYRLNFGPRISFDHRNRHEYFFRDNGSDFQRYRSRLRFGIPLNGQRLRKFSFSNEFFYDTRNHSFRVNRLVPVALTFQLSKRINLTAYYQWEHLRSNDSENHVLGTFLSF